MQRLPRLALLPLLVLAACQGRETLESREQAIIGGNTAAVGEFPTVVAVSNGGLCTGTLIAPDLVLTAAHCISPSLVGLASQAQLTAQTRVLLDTDDVFSGKGSQRQAAETIPHPDFNINGLGDNDIGLIRLTSPVLDRTPTPINRVHDDAPAGMTLDQVGFGATQVGGGGAGRLYALREKATTSCSSFGVLDANLLCFSQIDGSGKCQGDSGGPSFARVGGVERVVGVTSFGDQVCGQFGADTRVDAELDFLFSVAPELQCQSEGACNEACGRNGLPVDEDCSVCESDTECGDSAVCDSEGRCVAAPFTPGGEGSECTGNEECDSAICASSDESSMCTSSCASDADCFDGFSCTAAGESSVCWPNAEEGGCSTGGGSGALGGLFLMLALLALRRREPTALCAKR